MSGTDSYTVRLEDFEGPMDLLLYLIRKDEIDLHNIPIASITEQYLSHVKQLEVIGITTQKLPPPTCSCESAFGAPGTHLPPPPLANWWHCSGQIGRAHV